ncbi:MAG: Rnf-Nqr domain containing protein [Acutalibacteraceae bacterium]|nr:Rnf-Nqr domain containing protein [Acutalibacteraceae bacterium]
MLKIFSDMLITTLYAAVAQNLIFTASYGLSESIRTAKRPKHFFMYGITVTVFCILSSLTSSLLIKVPFLAALPLKFSYVLFIICLAVIYLIAAVFCKKLLHADKKFMNSLSMCAFNTLVAALPGINLKAGNTFANSIALGTGAGLAFVISLVLIRNGMRHINKNPHIPEFFKGTPALFIYVSLIALALSCVSGESLFI